MILWVDCETTGLNERAGSILEIAMVLTDDALNELGVFHSLVKPLITMNDVIYEGCVTNQDLRPMHEVVLAMHTKNGLLAELRASESVPRRFEVEVAAVGWIKRITESKAPAIVESVEKTLKATPLGGNSVHFDRAWLREHMPELEALFSYRNVDMSTVNELALRWTPNLWKLRSGADPETGKVDKEKAPHRALEDVRSSIETAKYYKSMLFER